MNTDLQNKIILMLSAYLDDMNIPADFSITNNGLVKVDLIKSNTSLAFLPTTEIGVVVEMIDDLFLKG